jgi:hypothetical protein
MDWTAMMALGAYHGINPGMGWLFAVALGMQRRSMTGVWRALPPIALGHAISVGVVVGVAALAGVVIQTSVLRAAIGAMLIALGTYQLWRHRHPRYGGMQVGFRDLTVWSFLMASAHGAGLMLLPWVIAMPPTLSASGDAHAGHAGHMATIAAGSSPWVGLLAVTVHTVVYLSVMTVAALIVYRKVGLAFLRSAWLNLDWAWAGALVVTGLVVLLG